MAAHYILDQNRPSIVIKYDHENGREVATIPQHKDNYDYRVFLDWLREGNLPDRIPKKTEDSNVTLDDSGPTGANRNDDIKGLGDLNQTTGQYYDSLRRSHFDVTINRIAHPALFQQKTNISIPQLALLLRPYLHDLMWESPDN